MKRLSPAELAKRLAVTLQESPDARERLLARILRLHLPHLSARKAGPRNAADRDLAYLVIAGVSEGMWDSEKAACDWLAQHGAIGGVSISIASRSSRLRQFISKNREFLVAGGNPSFQGNRTAIRFLSARLAGHRLEGDPEIAAGTEEYELDDLVEETKKSIQEDVEKARLAMKQALETLRKLRKSARPSRQIK